MVAKQIEYKDAQEQFVELAGGRFKMDKASVERCVRRAVCSRFLYATPTS